MCVCARACYTVHESDLRGSLGTTGKGAEKFGSEIRAKIGGFRSGLVVVPANLTTRVAA